MIVYVESSAALAGWLRQAGGAETSHLLRSAELCVTSDLTLMECDRAFHRAAALKQFSPVLLHAARAAAADLWNKSHVLEFEGSLVERARQRFPLEPIRTLDALHLAFYEKARRAFPALVMLSLDERVRSVARALGGEVLPPQ